MTTSVRSDSFAIGVVWNAHSLAYVTVGGLVYSALEVIFNVMRSINPRFTYLLTYLAVTSLLASTKLLWARSVLRWVLICNKASQINSAWPSSTPGKKLAQKGTPRTPYPWSCSVISVWLRAELWNDFTFLHYYCYYYYYYYYYFRRSETTINVTRCWVSQFLSVGLRRKRTYFDDFRLFVCSLYSLLNLCCNSFFSFFNQRIVNVWNSLPRTVDFTSLTSFKRTINDVDYSDFLKVFSF